MASPVDYRLEDRVAWIHMDDGKANAINVPLMDGILSALGRAEADGAGSVVLAGRLGFFSAGLDLKRLPVLPPDELRRVLLQFGDVTLRLVGFPRPVVAFAAGHALAGGAVLLLTADWRIGCEGAFKIGLNEVAIGIPMPSVVCELARMVLDPRWLHPSVGHGAVYNPTTALQAGFLSEVCSPAEIAGRVREKARALAALPDPAYAVTKARLRASVLESDARAALQDELSRSFSEMFGS